MESNKQLLRVLETISGTMIMIGTIFSKSSDCLFANKSVSNPKIIQRKLKKVINKATQAILDKAWIEKIGVMIESFLFVLDNWPKIKEAVDKTMMTAFPDLLGTSKTEVWQKINACYCLTVCMLNLEPSSEWVMLLEWVQSLLLNLTKVNPVLAQFPLALKELTQSMKISQKDLDLKAIFSKSSVQQKVESKKSEKKKSKGKRAIMPYIIFTNEKRSEVMKANPQFTMPEVAKEIGKMWTHLGEDQKLIYKERYYKEKQRLADVAATST